MGPKCLQFGGPYILTTGLKTARGLFTLRFGVTPIAGLEKAKEMLSRRLLCQVLDPQDFVFPIRGLEAGALGQGAWT